MDDDEEIELLRLAALKSLNVKKEHQLTQFNYHPHTGNAIQVLENITGSTHIPKYQHPDHEGQHICLTESFPRQIIATTTQPYSINQNVQLSPRSAAFVSENYGILMKRKGDTFRRSPSYKSSPGRWSVSPPPSKQKRLSPEPLKIIRKDDYSRPNEHKPLYGNNRVSPQRRISRSPTSKCRKISRSPPKNRLVSKSPMTYKATSPNFGGRSKSRSPGTISRSPPLLRHATPTKRSNSYRHSQVDNYKTKSSYSTKVNSGNLRKLDNYNRETYRRRPKVVSKSNTESNSKPKVDKSIRSYNEYQRRRSPGRTKYTKTYSNSENHQKNYDRPPINTMTRKKSIELNVDAMGEVKNHNEINEGGCNPNVSVSSNIEDKEITNIIHENESQTETTPITDNDEDSSNESNDEDDDGIDLFASEESESENEGRFKCSTSSKSEKPKSVSTVSFTKLGDTLTSSFTNLNDVGSNKNVKNKDSESERSYNKFSNRRDDRRVDKESNRMSNRTKVSTSLKSSAERKKSAKPMFKSTFHQVSENVTGEKPIGK